MEADNETSFPLSVSVTLIHGRPFKKPAPSPSQISTGTGDQISPGANRQGFATGARVVGGLDALLQKGNDALLYRLIQFR